MGHLVHRAVPWEWGFGLELGQNPVLGRGGIYKGQPEGMKGTGWKAGSCRLTNDKDRHEGPTGHWDGSGQCRHPEL